MPRLTAAALACLALVAATASSAARRSDVPAASCGFQSAGPGALRHGSGSGPECLLRAYDAHCRAASFRLSVFGVDTIATDTFTLAPESAGCRVLVRSVFKVVPNHSTLATGTCTRLLRVGSDIVAGGCRGQGLAAEISLDGGS